MNHKVPFFLPEECNVFVIYNNRGLLPTVSLIVFDFHMTIYVYLNAF